MSNIVYMSDFKKDSANYFSKVKAELISDGYSQNKVEDAINSAKLAVDVLQDLKAELFFVKHADSEEGKELMGILSDIRIFKVDYDAVCAVIGQVILNRLGQSIKN